MPGLSVGGFCYPPRRSARILIEEIINWSTLVETNGIRKIFIANWKEPDHEAFVTEMKEIQKNL